LFTRDFEKYVKEGSRNRASLSLSLSDNSERGTWRDGSFTEDSERYVKEGSGNRHLSP
jgi:hypothetical protein